MFKMSRNWLIYILQWSEKRKWIKGLTLKTLHSLIAILHTSFKLLFTVISHNDRYYFTYWVMKLDFGKFRNLPRLQECMNYPRLKVVQLLNLDCSPILSHYIGPWSHTFLVTHLVYKVYSLQIFLGKAFQLSCNGPNENDPHRRMYLNTYWRKCSLVGGGVQEN